jgi:serine protease Do
MLKKSLESFEASFYDRQKLRDIYEDVALSVVGVANSREAFEGISYDNVWSGVVMNTEG